MQTKIQNTAHADLMLIDLGKAEMPTYRSQLYWKVPIAGLSVTVHVTTDFMHQTVKSNLFSLNWNRINGIPPVLVYCRHEEYR